MQYNHTHPRWGTLQKAQSRARAGQTLTQTPVADQRALSTRGACKPSTALRWRQCWLRYSNTTQACGLFALASIATNQHPGAKSDRPLQAAPNQYPPQHYQKLPSMSCCKAWQEQKASPTGENTDRTRGQQVAAATGRGPEQPACCRPARHTKRLDACCHLEIPLQLTACMYC